MDFLQQWNWGLTKEKVNDLATLALAYGIKLVVAIILLIVGLWVINKFLRFTLQRLNGNSFDNTYKSFIRNLLNISLKVILVIAILNFIGFKTTSVLALLGAAGLAIGLALQGTLTNFASGVLIIMFKPFRVGDIIEAQGKKGIVNEIQIFTTLIKTEDNKVIIIPNNLLSNGIIENHTYKGNHADIIL